MPYFIGIDIGTQSTKALIIDDSGKQIALASVSYGFIKGLPLGSREQHPAQWIDAAEKAISMALKQSKINPKKVKAIGISGQQHGFVPLDCCGKVIRPAKLWNDTSTAKEARQIENLAGGKEKLLALAGNAIPAGFTAPKILWLKNNEPKNFKLLETVLLPHDFINFWLTGEKKMECGDASGTGLLDVRKRKWCRPLAETIDDNLLEKLPVIQRSEKPAGFVIKEIAKKFGFSEDVVVSSGGGDNMMSAIGTGNTKPGIITVSLGTSGTVFAFSKKPLVDKHGECAAFCDSTNNWLPLFCTMNVTVATELTKNAFGLDNNSLARIAKSVPAGSGGLLLAPYFEGERTPNYPNGTGVFFGVNANTFNKQFFSRAAIEGATFGLNYCLNRLRELGIDVKEIRLTGGGANNPEWRQIAADAFDAVVVCLKEKESAAFGAAIQAQWCLENLEGKTTDISCLTDALVKIDNSRVSKPIKKNVLVYKKLQKTHDKIGLQLNPLFESHRKFLTEGSS